MTFAAVARRCGIAGLLAVAGVIGISVATAEEAYADPLATAPLTWQGGGCNYLCIPCANEDRHYIVQSVLNLHAANHLETCNEGIGGCNSHQCGVTLASNLSAMWLAAQTNDVEALRKLLRENAELAAYNRDRGSIQVRCEAGTLVANIPLTADQAEALGE